MRAITFDRYTGPDGLALSDLPKPTPGPGEVLIRVEAASLNAYDWHQYRGEPTVMRAQTGFSVKEPRIVGSDVAGVVEAVGEGVETLAVGDQVFGDIGFGACAEFAVAAADRVAPFSTKVDFVQAAGAPLAGTTALQALRDIAAMKPGERVLVWGASGSVGHLAVQIALALGAGEVHAVCSGRNAKMVASLGAARAFDYTAGELPEPGAGYDVVIDTVATAPLPLLKSILAPGGRAVTVGALGGGKLLGPITSMVGRTLGSKLRGLDLRGMLAKSSQADLRVLAGWLADGSLRTVVQQTYPLDEAAEACRVLEDGHVAGKLIVAP